MSESAGAERVLLEICIDTLQGAVAAQCGGADRLEVCGPLSVGGVTPSAGLLRTIAEKVQLPLMVMIRPRDGSFCYSSHALQTMLADIEHVKLCNAMGVVFGALDERGAVDVTACRDLCQAAQPLSITFHRAFDDCRDPHGAVEALIELQVDRILTSGQSHTALEGLELLANLHQRYGDRITIMPGCGITPSNVAKIARDSRCREFHASASTTRDGSARRETCEETVRALKQALVPASETP